MGRVSPTNNCVTHVSRVLFDSSRVQQMVEWISRLVCLVGKPCVLVGFFNALAEVHTLAKHLHILHRNASVFCVS